MGIPLIDIWRRTWTRNVNVFLKVHSRFVYILWASDSLYYWRECQSLEISGSCAVLSGIAWQRKGRPRTWSGISNARLIIQSLDDDSFINLLLWRGWGSTQLNNLFSLMRKQPMIKDFEGILQGRDKLVNVSFLCFFSALPHMFLLISSNCLPYCFWKVLQL